MTNRRIQAACVGGRSRREGPPADFLEGLTTLCGCGSPKLHEGLAVHLYRATRSMENRAFSNADGNSSSCLSRAIFAL
ncbi:MAG: homogentisate 1,2-dioxygenase [Sphingomonadales bacterium]|nr:homogentisate 1,2-dioxygenase [Sphingomonadales bacterium]